MTLASFSKTLKSVQSIISFVMLAGALVVAAVLSWHALQDKPTRGEVDIRFESSKEERDVLKIAIDQHAAQFKALEDRMGRFSEVQKYQLAQSDWQGKVLEHLAGKNGPKPPESLQQLRRNLMQGQ